MNRLLVIEDEHPLRQQIVDMLVFEGFEVTGTENGRIGVRLAQEQLPDLIPSSKITCV